MSRSAWLAAVALHDCLEGVTLDRSRVATYWAVGASTGSMEDVVRILAASVTDGQFDAVRFARRGVAACHPLLAFQLMNNFTLCHGSIREGLQGPSGAFFEDPDNAMAEAVRALDQVPWVIVGAAESTWHPVARVERPGEPAWEGAVVLLLGRGEEGEAMGEAARDVTFSAVSPSCAWIRPALVWDEAWRGTSTPSGGSPPGEALRGTSTTEPLLRRPPTRRRAVITGVGAASAFGLGADALYQGLLAGAPGFSNAIPGFGPVGACPGGGTNRDRRVGLTAWAAREAWIQAGRPRVDGLSLAMGLEQAWLEELLALWTPDGLDWARHRPERLYRSAMDVPARVVAAELQIERTVVHASACAGGTLALIQAVRWIEDGFDRVLCGAGDSMLNPLGLAGLHKLGVPSLRGACRPFDARRDGILIGEGAGCLMVESESAARTRGARILAFVRGFADTQDGYALTAPDPTGAAIRRAMAGAIAGVDPTDVLEVNAHGTGTPLNDAVEATVLSELIPRAQVGSFKGAIGHTMAAAGAVELAAVVASFGRGVLPGTCGFERADPACPVEVRGAGPMRGRFLLKNSFGFGGQNASVLLEQG